VLAVRPLSFPSRASLFCSDCVEFSKPIAVIGALVVNVLDYGEHLVISAMTFNAQRVFGRPKEWHHEDIFIPVWICFEWGLGPNSLIVHRWRPEALLRPESFMFARQVEYGCCPICRNEVMKMLTSSQINPQQSIKDSFGSRSSNAKTAHLFFLLMN
jgi:hypothetical protein